MALRASGLRIRIIAPTCYDVDDRSDLHSAFSETGFGYTRAWRCLLWFLLNRIHMSVDVVVHSFSYNLQFLRDQVADVDAPDMVAQPHGIANHPAWTLGHLTLSCQAIGGEVGLPDWLPSTWGSKFGTGSLPESHTSFYPLKQKLLAALDDGEQKIVNALGRMSEAQLDEPLPDESFRAILPTVRHAVIQVLVAHSANHVGQLTVWRSAMNLPRIARPFL